MFTNARPPGTDEHTPPLADVRRQDRDAGATSPGPKYEGPISTLGARWLGGGMNDVASVAHGTTSLHTGNLQSIGMRKEHTTQTIQDNSIFWNTAAQSASRTMKDTRLTQMQLAGLASPLFSQIQKYNNWKKLENPREPDKVYTWYNQMRGPLTRMGVPLARFEQIVPGLGPIGLCTPGVGESVYNRAGMALTEALEATIPEGDPDNFGATLSRSTDGWNFLYYLLYVVSKVLDTAVVAHTPTYTDDIHQLANKWVAHRVMMVHRGNTMSKYACSREFLRAVKGGYSAAANVAMSILVSGYNQWHIRESHRGKMPQEMDYVLPPEMEIETLVNTILREGPSTINMPDILQHQARQNLNFNRTTTDARFNELSITNDYVEPGIIQGGVAAHRAQTDETVDVERVEYSSTVSLKEEGFQVIY